MEPEPKAEPLSIGEFARACRLSARALRLYDASGLLLPARVDPDTGYRWYAAEQLQQARWIARLRELEVPLAEIAELLALDPPTMATRLRQHSTTLRQVTDARVALIEHLASRLEGHRRHPMDVHTRDVPARRLVTCAKLVTVDDLESFTAAQVARYAGENPLPRPEGITGAPFLRYHGELGPDTETLVEFCCPVTDDAEPGLLDHDRSGMVTVVREDAHRCAYVEVSAHYAYSSLPFEVINDWLIDHDSAARSFPEQIILARPHGSTDDQIVYQIAVPIICTGSSARM